MKNLIISVIMECVFQLNEDTLKTRDISKWSIDDQLVFSSLCWTTLFFDKNYMEYREFET